MDNASLVIGAHFDDCEGGSAAGVSAKLAKSGWKVVFLNTIGDHSSWSFVGTKEREEQLLAEACTAARRIGAEKIFLPYQHNRFMPEDREAVAAVARVVQALNPELIFIPWPHDHHYDHARTARVALEAISYTNRFAGGMPVQSRLREVLAYEMSSWQTYDFTPDFYVNMADEAEAVFDAIREFHILGETGKVYEEEKRTRTRLCGITSHFAYAEGLKHLGPMFPIKSILPEILGEGNVVPAGSLQYPWGGKFF